MGRLFPSPSMIINYFSVDPSFASETTKSTPAGVAAREGHVNLLDLLSEHTHVPNIARLCLLINTEKDGKPSDEFQALLKATSLDELSNKDVDQRTLLQHATINQREGHLKMLLDFG